MEGEEGGDTDALFRTVVLKLSGKLSNVFLWSLDHSLSPPLPQSPNMAAGVGLPVGQITASHVSGGGAC